MYAGVPEANPHVQPSRTELRELVGCKHIANASVNIYLLFFFCFVEFFLAVFLMKMRSVLM